MSQLKPPFTHMQACSHQTVSAILSHPEPTVEDGKPPSAGQDGRTKIAPPKTQMEQKMVPWGKQNRPQRSMGKSMRRRYFLMFESCDTDAFSTQKPIRK